mgnify:CR=1 FL=1
MMGDSLEIEVFNGGDMIIKEGFGLHNPPFIIKQ